MNVFASLWKVQRKTFVGVLCFALIAFVCCSVSAPAKQPGNLIRFIPSNKETPAAMFQKFSVPLTKKNLREFGRLNGISAKRNNTLPAKKTYYFPIKKIQYDGTSVLSSLKTHDADYAAAVERYNDAARQSGARRDDFRNSRILWVPLWLSEKKETTAQKSTPAPDAAPSAAENAEQPNSDGASSEKELSDNPDENMSNVEPSSKSSLYKHAVFVSLNNKKERRKRLGKRYASLTLSDRALAGQVFYIDPGHGGPDPGAIGYRKGHELHEDEYAYDVSLRLAYMLLTRGATVYLIVQDDRDGIRDERYLGHSSREKYIGGFPISHGHRERLQQRTDIINELYDRNAKTAKKQVTITIHVDSRIVNQRIDVFFYYATGSVEGKSLSETLLRTMREKYQQAQPGRGYEGTSEARELYVLRNTKTISSYIELGNIRNANDQVRLIEPYNRQAIAKWLADGLVKSTGN